MTLQSLKTLKTFNRSMLALIVIGIAIAGASLDYTLSFTRQESAESAVTVPVNEPVTALGRLQPILEVVRVAAPTTLNNDQGKNNAWRSSEESLCQPIVCSEARAAVLEEPDP